MNNANNTDIQLAIYIAICLVLMLYFDKAKTKEEYHQD